MSNRFALVRAVICCVVMLTASGCSQSRHEGTETFYLVGSNTKVPYWQSVLAGLNRAASDLQVKATMVGPEKYNPKEQRGIFRDIVAKKPTGIMISASDPVLLKDDIDAAIAAGIPVITVDSDAPKSKRLLFIGTNNYQAGISGGQVLAKRLGDKGNVVVMTSASQDNLSERLRGYQAALAYTNVKVIQVVDVQGDPSLAFDKILEIIDSARIKVDGFVGLDSTAGKSAAEVLDRRHVKGKTIVAMDADPGTLDWIEKGAIAATIAQKPFTMGYYGLRVLDDLHHNKLAKLDANWGQDLQSLVPSIIDTGSALIDSTNVGTIKKVAANYTVGEPRSLALLLNPGRLPAPPHGQ